MSEKPTGHGLFSIVAATLTHAHAQNHITTVDREIFVCKIFVC